MIRIILYCYNKLQNKLLYSHLKLYIKKIFFKKEVNLLHEKV